MDKSLLAFREVKISDAKDWCFIANKVWRDAYKDIFPEEVFIERDKNVNEKIDSFKNRVLNSDSNISYVALYDGKVIGIMGGKIKTTYDFLDDNYADLTVLYIDPKYQGLGIGSELKNIFEQWIKLNGVNKYVICVLKGNIKARKVYEAWGGTLLNNEDNYDILGVSYPTIFYTFDL